LSDITIRAGAPTQVSPEFLQGMTDRMAVSFHKYGDIRDAYPDDVDAIQSLFQRLVRYEEDGNTEWLMDVANFAMIEFMFPRHRDAHYRATDSDESPGRIRTDGKWAGQAHNLDVEVR
jgi:hypothetical protein